MFFSDVASLTPARPGCFAITTVFSHAQTVVTCAACASILCQPTGGKARLTEGACFLISIFVESHSIHAQDVHSARRTRYFLFLIHHPILACLCFLHIAHRTRRQQSSRRLLRCKNLPTYICSCAKYELHTSFPQFLVPGLSLF